MAREINAEQAALAGDSGQYASRERLKTAQPVPSGFQLTLQAGAQSYVFILKDRTDPCRFAVFSDSEGIIYQTAQRTAPLVAQR
jgi:hypothetical protein